MARGYIRALLRDGAGNVATAAILAAMRQKAAIMSGLDLQRIQLPRSRLRGADLRDANLSGATLYGVDLTHARLEGADLDGARLYDPELGRRRRVEQQEQVEEVAEPR